MREFRRLHLTLREMLANLLTLRLAALVSGAIAICVIAGPFHTLEMPVMQRAAYWAVAIVVATAMSVSTITYAFVGPLAPRVPPLVRGLVASVVFSLVYAGFLVALGTLFFPTSIGLPRYVGFIGYTMPIAIGITIIVYLFQRSTDADGASDGAAGEKSGTPPRILARIKPGLGAQLTRLTMQDHYVEVFTDKGSQLVLMRFADALAEVEPTPGWRIHRSHWVSEAAMADIRRSEGKTFVVLHDGAELPISRTYLPKMRDAGVLKRFG